MDSHPRSGTGEGLQVKDLTPMHPECRFLVNGLALKSQKKWESDPCHDGFRDTMNPHPTPVGLANGPTPMLHLACLLSVCTCVSLGMQKSII